MFKLDTTSGGDNADSQIERPFHQCITSSPSIRSCYRPTPPTIPDIPLAAKAVAIIAVHKNQYLTQIQLQQHSYCMTQKYHSLLHQKKVQTKMSIVMPIQHRPLPENPVIPLIAPENQTIDALQPADPPPIPTANEAGEPVISLNHG